MSGKLSCVLMLSLACVSVVSGFAFKNSFKNSFKNNFKNKQGFVYERRLHALVAEQGAVTLDKVRKAIQHVTKAECDVGSVSPQMDTCVQQLDALEGMADPQELCNEFSTLKSAVYECMEWVAGDDCDSLVDLYKNIVQSVLAPLDSMCAGEIPGNVGGESCDTEEFEPDFEACISTMGNNMASCKSAYKAIDDARKCMMKIGKNDAKWGPSCEMLRTMMLGVLDPMTAEVDKHC